MQVATELYPNLTIVLCKKCLKQWQWANLDEPTGQCNWCSERCVLDALKRVNDTKVICIDCDNHLADLAEENNTMPT